MKYLTRGFISVNLAAVLFGVLSCSKPPPALKAAQPVEAGEENLLQGEELLQRLAAVTALKDRQDDEALKELLRDAKHPDYLIRVQALKSLNRSVFYSRPDVLTVFVEALDDEHWLVRSVAVKALGKDSRPEGKDGLRKRLPHEENERVQKYIIDALTK